MARERKSREEWRRIVARLRASDWTPEYFANRHNLSLNTLRWWSSQFAADEDVAPSATLVPVSFTAESAVSAPTIELDLGAVRIRIEHGADPAYVATLVHALLESRAGC